MKVRKIITFVLMLSLVLSMALVPAHAAELPEGVIKVYNAANDANTRNEEWKDKETGIITLPQGEEFDGGGTNHGVYHLYDEVKEGDIFYIYWIINVEENDDLFEDDIILSQDPWYLESYEVHEVEEGSTEPDRTEVPSGTTALETLLVDYESLDFYYGDATPGKWQAIEYGFEVFGENTNYVQHRLHYKNLTSVQVKYIIITSKPMIFDVNEETGEIDGVTNDNEFVVVTPTPTPTPTEKPAETPKQTTEAPNTTAPASTTAGTANQSESDGGNTGLIIGIVAAVVVVAVIVGIVIAKKKK